MRAVRKGVPLRPSDLRQYPRAAGVRLLRERRKPAGAELQRRTVLRCQPLGYRAGRHRVRGGLRRTFPAAPHGGGDLRGTPSAARFQIPAKRPARHFPRDTRPPKGRPLGLLHGHGLPSGRSESLPAAGVRYAGDLRFGVPWYPLAAAVRLASGLSEAERAGRNNLLLIPRYGRVGDLRDVQLRLANPGTRAVCAACTVTTSAPTSTSSCGRSATDTVAITARSHGSPVRATSRWPTIGE